MFSDEPRLSKDFEAFIQESPVNKDSNNESPVQENKSDGGDVQVRETDGKSESTANGEYGKAIEYVHLVKVFFLLQPHFANKNSLQINYR